MGQKALYLGQKTMFLRVLGSKFKKQGQKQGFPNIPNLQKIKFGICSIPNFPKITKNDLKVEFRKSRKTRSDSKTDSNVQFKVRNAGP